MFAELLLPQRSLETWGLHPVRAWGLPQGSAYMGTQGPASGLQLWPVWLTQLSPFPAERMETEVESKLLPLHGCGWELRAWGRVCSPPQPSLPASLSEAQAPGRPPNSQKSSPADSKLCGCLPHSVLGSHREQGPELSGSALATIQCLELARRSCPQLSQRPRAHCPLALKDRLWFHSPGEAWPPGCLVPCAN